MRLVKQLRRKYFVKLASARDFQKLPFLASPRDFRSRLQKRHNWVRFQPLMSKSLIITEKPSVASDIAKALGKVPKRGDHYENEQYVIGWAVGYFTELLMPEDIDKKQYGFWRLETLPIIPKKFELKPKVDSKEVFDRLKKLIARKDIKEIINACDAGREGEHIFNQLCELAKNKHPVKRLW